MMAHGCSCSCMADTTNHVMDNNELTEEPGARVALTAMGCVCAVRG